VRHTLRKALYLSFRPPGFQPGGLFHEVSMSLDVKEFSNLTGPSTHVQQPPIGGASLTTGGTTTYTVSGPGFTFVELYANGVGHSFTVSDSALSQSLNLGERVVYGMRGGATITVTV
jgi:hypothetical protein